MNRLNTPDFRRKSTAIAASLFCSFTSVAYGQADIPPAPQAAASAAAFSPTATAVAAAPNDAPQTLDKVIVTAQKREQAALDVPASVTAVSAERLSRGGLTRLEDYAAQVPGLSLTSVKQGVTQVTLRGISTGVSQSAATTSFYIDEAPIGSVNAYAAGSSITPDLDPADLRRIEILKGPQGTLYGAGAIGGLLRYVTIPPDYERFSGSITLGANQVSSGGTGSVGRVSLNVPVRDDTMALRVSAFSRKDAGFIDDVNGRKDVNGTTVDGGRLAFGWKLTTDWTVNASALTQRVKSSGLSVEDVDGKTLQPLYGDLKQKRFVEEPSNVQLDVYNVTVHGSVGDYSLVSSTTYQQVSSTQLTDGTFGYGAALGAAFKIPDLGIRVHLETNTKRWSQELRARSTAFDDKLEYEGGVYFTHESDTNHVPAFDPFSTTTGAPYPLPTIINAAIDTRYEEYSAFANGTYAVTPEFDVQAGLRYGTDHQKYSQNYSGLLVGPTPVLIDSGSSKSVATYLLTGRYKPSKDDSLYARIATGYRPGGPNAVPPAAVTTAPQSFKPDTLTSYEIGYKSVLAGGLVSLEAALFDTKWKDIQIQTSAGGFNFFVNGGAATSKGAELSLYVFPMAGLSLRATGGYTSSKLTEDAPAAGGLSGDRLPFVPTITASVGAEYRWAPAAGWNAFTGGSLNYVGKRRSDFSQKAAVDVPTYHTFDVNAGVERGQWRVSLYAKNLGDARGITYLKTENLVPSLNPFAEGVIQPRTVGVDVNYRF